MAAWAWAAFNEAADSKPLQAECSVQAQLSNSDLLHLVGLILGVALGTEALGEGRAGGGEGRSVCGVRWGAAPRHACRSKAPGCCLAASVHTTAAAGRGPLL